MDVKKETPHTLQQAIRYFSDPDVCLRYMVAMRWPDGVTCPNCGSKDVRFISTRRVWECKTKHAKRQFSAKVGTVFEDSAIGLDKWFAAVWLIANCKNGVSSYEIARGLGVTQKTGWFMLHRIRLAMQARSFEKLGGGGKIVEVDETFIGAKARSMNARQRRKAKVDGIDHGPYAYTGRAIVLAAVERGGRVHARTIQARSRRELLGTIVESVKPGTEVHTDELPAYAGLDPRRFRHQVINHSVAYVKGNVHTNNVENFWNCLKRGIRGTYVSVEPFHLFRYLDEQSFRFNNRKASDAERFRGVLSLMTGKRLTYRQLIGLPQVQTA